MKEWLRSVGLLLIFAGGLVIFVMIAADFLFVVGNEDGEGIDAAGDSFVVPAIAILLGAVFASIGTWFRAAKRGK